MFLKIVHYAMSGNRTRVNCLEGSYAHHYTNIAWLLHVQYISNSILEAIAKKFTSPLFTDVDSTVQNTSQLAAGLVCTQTSLIIIWLCKMKELFFLKYIYMIAV